MSLKGLKSGSDIRGQAVDQPGTPTTLTPLVVERLGYAFVQWLTRKLHMPARGLSVAVGRDSRVTGEALLAAMARGLALGGARVLDCGLCTTPAMFLTTSAPQTGCQAAVMVTASHHPWYRNGCKFITAQGGLTGGDIDSLIQIAEGATPPSLEPDPPETVDFLSVYRDHLSAVLRGALGSDAPRPLQGLHIAVDAGNGAGGFYAEFLAQLGANTTGSRYLDPDGRFPNHVPNPEDDTAMEAICRAVAQSNADLGVIFDTDCDRAAVVGSGGAPIHRDRLIALTAAMLLEQHPGASIVTDSVTSLGLARFIAGKAGVHRRYKRGYKNVIDEAVRLNAQGIDCPLAIETSGHAALRENGFLDDGMYLATRLIAYAMSLRAKGQTLQDVIEKLEEPLESVEIRLNITGADFRTVGQAALAAVECTGDRPGRQLAPDNAEGVRLLFDLGQGATSGFAMIRLSVHDPVLPVNVQSQVPGGAKAMLGALKDALSGISDIDLLPLEAY